MTGYGVTFSTANIALTAFLGASAAGVLAGGYLADRTSRHGSVAAACFGINAVIITIIATVNLPSVVLTPRWDWRASSVASSRRRATCWSAMRHPRVPPAAPSASSRPVSISAAS